MAEVTYTVAGQTVTLDIAKVNPGTRYAAVYDPTECDLLYTHHYIDVNCLWNPFATAALPNPAGAPPQFVPNPRDPNLNLPLAVGNDPMTSFAGLHQFLMTPQGKITVSEGGITLIASPRNFGVLNQGKGRQGPALDAKNGPRPVSCEIIKVHGPKTIEVRYVIETWLQEVDPNLTSMLSHRWTMQHTVNVDNFMLTNKRVEGLAIFRSDELSIVGNLQKIDDFRIKFGHPIPDGAMRKNVTVKAEADGLQIRYSFDDEEQVTNFPPQYGIVKAEVFDEWGMDWHSGWMPASARTVTIRLWGKRTVTRTALGAAARNILEFITVGAWTKIPTRGFNIKVDMINRFVDISYTSQKSGWLQGIVVLIQNPSLDDITNQGWSEKIGDVGNTAVGPNVAPPGSGGTRGTFLERLVTQALGVAGTAPAVPPSPGTAQDIN